MIANDRCIVPSVIANDGTTVVIAVAAMIANDRCIVTRRVAAAAMVANLGTCVRPCFGDLGCNTYAGDKSDGCENAHGRVMCSA